MAPTLEHESKGTRVIVSEEKAAYYLPKGWRVAVESAPPASEPGAETVVIPVGEPDESWKVPQIDAFAEREGFDLSEASKKGDKLAAIGTALAARAAASEPGAETVVLADDTTGD